MKKSLPPAYHSLAIMLPVIHTCLDPMLMTTFDTKLRKGVLELLGHKWKTSSRGPVNSIDSPVVNVEVREMIATRKMDL